VDFNPQLGELIEPIDPPATPAKKEGASE